MAAVEELVTGDMQELARKHLWMHFTRMGALRRGPRDPDHRPRRGLLRLRPARPPLPRRAVRAVLREHRPRPRGGRPGRRRPGARSSASSPTGPTRTRSRSSSPRASPASRPATSTASSSPRGGREAVDSALKLCRQYHKLTGNAGRYKVISRKLAYHGTTMGALTATGIPDARRAVRAAVPRLRPRRQHEPLPARGRRPGRGDPRADRVGGPGDRLVRDPRARPELRRLLRPARGLLPARARDLRRVRRAVHLRRGDLLLGPARRVVRRRALRLRARPHHDRQGPHLLLRADGRGDRLRPRLRPFAEGASRSGTASRSAGTRWRAPSRWPTSTCSSDEDLLRERARATRARSRAMLDSLRDIPIVGDVRGTGYFWAHRARQDRATKETFTADGVRLAAARLPLRRDLRAAG